MRILFMGTPEFAVPSLERLAQSEHEIVAVVTGADRPRGRGKRVTPTPVAQVAYNLGIPVLKPLRVREPSFIDQVDEMGMDAMVLVAFGQIIPKALLDIPPFGCINVHPSLLPKHRGASPIQAPLLSGEALTGVTTMIMNEQLDAGDMVMQQSMRIGIDDNAGDLHDRLAEMGAQLLLQTLDRFTHGAVAVVPQDDRRASYAQKVQSTEIDWRQDAHVLCGTIRGLSPFPGAYTFLGSTRVKLLRAAVCKDRLDQRVDPASQVDSVPGSVCLLDDTGIVVSTGSGLVRLTQVQPEGKRPMSAADYARGYGVKVGSRFGSLSPTS